MTSKSPMANRPPPQVVVLIGAARSGTKLLRDLFATHPAAASVPYDINFVWRSVAKHAPDDEINASTVTPASAQRVRRKLARFQGSALVLVEKTVSNCLRVPLVHAVVPEAKFIHLVRDGRDVVESARRQWTAPADWTYIFAKARAFPSLAVRRYGFEYARGLMRRRARKGGPPPTWGPRYRGIDDDLVRLGLLKTVARQWGVCVERALDGLTTLPAGQVHTLCYEDLVAEPNVQLRKLWSFAGLDPPVGLELTDMVDPNHVGRHRAMAKEELEAAMPHLRGPLTRLGYPLSSQAQEEPPPR